MIKKPKITLAVEKAIAIELKAIDKVVDLIIEPLSDIGNPEKLIGKRYEYWTQDDLNKLIQIYGTGKDTPLTRLIFNREYEILKVRETEYGRQ